MDRTLPCYCSGDVRGGSFRTPIPGLSDSSSSSGNRDCYFPLGPHEGSSSTTLTPIDALLHNPVVSRHSAEGPDTRTSLAPTKNVGAMFSMFFHVFPS